MSNYDNSFDQLIGNEGKFQSEASDRGNWTSGVVGKGELKGTKFGISAASYPKLDIASLTLEQAKEIYKNDYWDKFHGDDLEAHVAFQLFDADVQHGQGNAVRMLQRALGVNDDGIIGAITLGALQAKDPQEFMMLFIAERLTFMTKTSMWASQSVGLALRLANNLRLGAK